MRRVSHRVKHGDNVLVKRGIDENGVARGDADVLRERAVAVNAH